MKYYYSVASDNISVNGIEQAICIADIENWHECGEFESDTQAHKKLAPAGLYVNGKFNYKHTASGIAEQTKAEKASQTFAQIENAPTEAERIAALEAAMLTMIGGSANV